MKTQRAENRMSYNNARLETKRIKQLAKSESWTKIREDLKNDLGGTNKLIYNTTRNYRKGSQPPSYVIKYPNENTLQMKHREIKLRWRNYFETLAVFNIPTKF